MSFLFSLGEGLGERREALAAAPSGLAAWGAGGAESPGAGRGAGDSEGTGGVALSGGPSSTEASAPVAGAPERRGHSVSAGGRGAERRGLRDAPRARSRAPQPGRPAPAPSCKGPQPPSPAGTRARRPARSPLAIARSLPASLQARRFQPPRRGRRSAAPSRRPHSPQRPIRERPAVDLVSPQTSLASSTAQTWVRAALCGRGADGLADGPGRRGNGSRAEAQADGRAQPPSCEDCAHAHQRGGKTAAARRPGPRAGRGPCSAHHARRGPLGEGAGPGRGPPEAGRREDGHGGACAPCQARCCRPFLEIFLDSFR
ncbi:uncharacterized protein LOC141573956 [Camelus bactrianus]|uniref:Uncharacterized protein LOC141573956 n=1 Tax=Camelus bactrianus TaxID=9837 RepID=A0AC58NYV0_CAMBA